ncbi:outer membrane protein assembly factor [Vibrio sp. S11_S32]|uniref:autotransporter assembly complex protein TamA n=1 Tax=Vibrio sp. S11_S32 TaxID=2720225 RepID=UPI0016815367|nr:autotransporter assembly complex family protein [Vibrio sp. S11_S32]MBD1576336.1 outer membrane protein assembly factor [Vibrio sp. S11_S32]
MKYTYLSLLISSLLLLPTTASYAETELTIKGVEGKTEDNISAYLSSIKEDQYSVSLRFQSQLETNIRDALKALGYYNPDITFTVEGEASEEDNELIVQIDKGVPSIIYISDIDIKGEAAADKDFIRLIDNSKLNLGQVLNHGHYESLKSAMRNLALQKGYFDGQFVDARLQVSPQRNQAFIHLHYQSGPRYLFGDTSIKGSQIEDPRVRSLLPYKEGDPYQSVSVGLLNQNLSSTEWFSSVSVQPDLEHSGKTKKLPMKVNLEPQTKNQIETGLGYSTDVGPRGKLSWKKPWLNKYGHSTGASVMLSSPEKTFIANYKIPLVDVLHDYYLVQYGFKDENENDTDSQEQNLSFERHWLYDDGWHRSIYVRLLYEDYVQASESGHSLFALPGISFSRVRTRGTSGMPMWGDKQSIKVEYGDPAVLSDTRVLRVIGHTGWVRGAGENHRFLTRLDAGGTFAEDWDKVPPSLRFFVGGINSLRGYGYEDISPENSEGELEGGAYMATSSFEYQYRITGNWWWATFADFGDAWTDTPQWKTGLGMGLRWGSPVGPVRLDFAYGQNADKGDQFKIHFTLGPEL